MTYDPSDAERDAAYDQLYEEMYREIAPQAVDEFTAERLTSFYIQHPDIMRPALAAIEEGSWQQQNQRHSAALVFYVSAVELLLKATVLKPVIYGLVHNEALAEVIVSNSLRSTGFDPYWGLLKKLSKTLANLDLDAVRRSGQADVLINECRAIQDLRNRVIHRGTHSTPDETETARLVAAAVLEEIVRPLLKGIGLRATPNGQVQAGR